MTFNPWTNILYAFKINACADQWKSSVMQEVLRTTEELAAKEAICVWVHFPGTDGEAFSPECATAARPPFSRN